MPKSTGQQVKVLAILDILKRYADEENPINAIEISDKLSENGIEAERKAVYRGIEALIDYGYDVIQTRSPRAGYYLAHKTFQLPEIYLLTDAVQAASFITVKKTRELVRKLDSMLSEGERSKREKGLYIDNGHKCENEEIYYNIDTLSNAIALKKKVTLTYTVRQISENKKLISKNKEYKLSPYALIWQNEHYYLVANNEKYDNLMHIRLDRAKGISITKEDFRHFREVSCYSEHFDIADYAAKSFQMHTGKLTEITLRCSSEIIEQVVDRFSDKIFIRNNENGWFSFSTKVMLSAGLVNWILQFSDKIKVEAPNELLCMVKERIKDLSALYK